MRIQLRPGTSQLAGTIPYFTLRKFFKAPGKQEVSSCHVNTLPSSAKRGGSYAAHNKEPVLKQVRSARIYGAIYIEDGSNYEGKATARDLAVATRDGFLDVAITRCPCAPVCMY